MLLWDYGGYQNFSITPDSEYHILDVLVDGSSVGVRTWYNFTDVQADHTISATFAQTSFTIFASAGAGGISNRVVLLKWLRVGIRISRLHQTLDII
jgi:hypothetical protein